METHIIVAIIGLFFAIWFTFINVLRAMAKQNVPTANMFVMAIAWTTFISALWLVA